MVAGARMGTGECPQGVQAAHGALFKSMAEGLERMDGKLDLLLEKRVEDARREAAVDGRLAALEKTAGALEGEEKEQRGRWAGLWPQLVTGVLTTVATVVALGLLAIVAWKNGGE